MRRIIATAAAYLSLLVLGALGPDDPHPATSTVKAYLKRLSENRPQLGIDECLDIREIDRRAFGAAWESLEPARRAYVEQMTSVSLKAAAGMVPMDKVMATARRTPFKVTPDGEEVEVSFTIEFTLDAGGAAKTGAKPDTAQHESTMRLRHDERGWKIVDIDHLVSRWKAALAGGSESGLGPVEFMEGVTLAIIDDKHQPGTLARKEREVERGLQDAMAGNIQVQLDTLANLLELFKARQNRYPDLLHAGWTEMIKGGYLKSAPVNPVNRSSKISAGAEGKADSGWNWDEKTGTLRASYFDENTGATTPGQP